MCFKCTCFLFSLISWVPLRSPPSFPRDPKGPLPGVGPHPGLGARLVPSALPTPDEGLSPLRLPPPPGRCLVLKTAFREFLWLSPNHGILVFQGRLFCHTRQLVGSSSSARNQTQAPAVEVQSANYLTHRAFPQIFYSQIDSLLMRDLSTGR